MATVPIYLVGTILTKSPKGGSSESGLETCVIHGLASIEGVGATPPIHLGPGGDIGGPPGIWGGPIIPGHPAFPIWGPPGIELPPGSGYPPVAGQPLPPGEEKPQPIVGWEAKPIWTPDTGWAIIAVPKSGTEVPTPSRK